MTAVRYQTVISSASSESDSTKRCVLGFWSFSWQAYDRSGRPNATTPALFTSLRLLMNHMPHSSNLGLQVLFDLDASHPFDPSRSPRNRNHRHSLSDPDFLPGPFHGPHLVR